MVAPLAVTYQPKIVNLKPEDEYQGKPRGLGDVVHTVIKATGLDRLAPKGCGCAKRRETLNRNVPFVKATESL
jgi:hypothetical protein